MLTSREKEVRNLGSSKFTSSVLAISSSKFIQPGRLKNEVKEKKKSEVKRIGEVCT